MDKLNFISLLVSITSFLIPLFAGIKNRRTLLWTYILIGFAFDILLLILKWYTTYNLYPFANLYVLIEFLLLSFYYNMRIAKPHSYYLLFTLSLGSFYVVQTLLNGIESRNGLGATIFYVAYLLYALLGFYTISKKPVYANITTSSFFWVNVAILLGSSGRVILFLFEDYLIAHQNTYLGHLWIVYRMLNVLINILFAIALTRRYE